MRRALPFLILLLLPGLAKGVVCIDPHYVTTSFAQPQTIDLSLSSTTGVPLTTKLTSGDTTSDLLDLENSAGAKLFSVANGGGFTTRAASTINPSSAGVPLTLKLASGDTTSDLLDLQNSAGTNMVSISNNGKISLPNVGGNLPFLVTANGNFSNTSSGFNLSSNSDLTFTASTIYFNPTERVETLADLGSSQPSFSSYASTGAYNAYTYDTQNSPTTFEVNKILGVTFRTVSGAQPASVATNGTAAVNNSWTAPAGGNTTGTTGQTAGAGSGFTFTAGAGGTAPAGSTNGAGGGVLLQAAPPGAGLGTAGAAGNVTVQPQASANSTTAFQVLTAAGGSVLDTDTVNTRVGVGTAAPGALFDVGGNLRADSTGTVIKYSGTTTAGMGIAPIVASSNQLALTTALTGATFTPTTSGSFRANSYVNVTAWATPSSFAIQLTYTDDGGTVRTVVIPVLGTGGAYSTTAAPINAIGIWQGSTFTFSANAAAITVQTAGTFTGSPTYNFYSSIERLR